jgi:transposase
MARQSYPSGVRDDAWACVAPSVTLMAEGGPQRTRRLREVFNAPRETMRAGAPWRGLPRDLPPWEAVYPPTRRGRKAGGFEVVVQDLRVLPRLAAGRTGQSSAAIFESRTPQSMPARGPRAGDDGAKRQRGGQVPLAVAPLGPLPAWPVTAANAQDRVQVEEVAEHV